MRPGAKLIMMVNPRAADGSLRDAAEIAAELNANLPAGDRDAAAMDEQDPPAGDATPSDG